MNLKQLKESKNMTVRQLADAAGLSKRIYQCPGVCRGFFVCILENTMPFSSIVSVAGSLLISEVFAEFFKSKDLTLSSFCCILLLESRTSKPSDDCSPSTLDVNWLLFFHLRY